MNIWSRGKARVCWPGILVKVLRDERRTEKLVSYLRTANGSFAGGTVGELVQHVLDNNLTLRYGSQTHALFTELMYDLKNEVDARIALLEDRVERYKAQNPAHNAALKEQLISWPYHYGWWRYARCGFPGYWGYWGYSRPSTFNFPQGLQPAGLQSNAYGRGLPQRKASIDTVPIGTSADRARLLLSHTDSNRKQKSVVQQTARG